MLVRPLLATHNMCTVNKNVQCFIRLNAICTIFGIWKRNSDMLQANWSRREMSQLGSIESGQSQYKTVY